jgi:hypothetical protein
MAKQRTTSTFRLSTTGLNVIVGGAWAIYDGITRLFGGGLGILYGILLIVLGLVAIITTGLIRLPKWLPFTWWALLILGVLIWILGSTVGAVLIIVAGVALLLVK